MVVFKYCQHDLFHLRAEERQEQEDSDEFWQKCYTEINSWNAGFDVVPVGDKLKDLD